MIVESGLGVVVVTGGGSAGGGGSGDSVDTEVSASEGSLSARRFTSSIKL